MTSDTVIPRPLPGQVFDERASLLWRGRRLGELLDPLLTPASFDAWTLASAAVTESELARIHAGSLAWGKGPQTWDISVSYLVDAMRDQGATWVVPDSMQHADDPRPRPFPHWGSELLVAGDNLLYLARDPDPVSIKNAWDDAGSAAGMLGLLTTAVVPRMTASDQDLARIAEASLFVVASGYDSGDRLIFFERKD